MNKAALPVLALVLGLPGPLLAADVVTVPSIDADFTPEQRVKLEQALIVANRVLSSTAFRDEVSAIEGFNYSRDDGATVYQALLRQNYTLEFKAVAKYAIRFRVFGRWVTRKSKMIASTGEGSGKITFNTVRMAEFGVAYYAGTIVHELTHIAGYHHKGNRPTTANTRSVPYRVGKLVRRLAESSAGDAAPNPGSNGSAGGLTGALGGTSGDTDTASPSDDASPAPRRRTFAARIRRTLARLFRR